MKKGIILLMMFSLSCILAGCSQGKDAVQIQTSAAAESEEQPLVSTETHPNSEILAETEPEVKKHHVEINIKDYGTVSVELDAEHAPVTVDNFLKLAGEGFYDGLTFHRIINGFMMQGGDPLGTGLGGSEETIKGEFSSNGVENPLSHTRGAISMARSNSYDSASSQFFIVHQDSTYLDGDYAAFGYVTSGMEIVDKICENIITEDGNGTVKTENQPVIESIKVVD